MGSRSAGSPRHPSDLGQTKIIAVSAAVFPVGRRRRAGERLPLFLQKPCLPDALVAEIERLLEQTGHVTLDVSGRRAGGILPATWRRRERGS